MSASETHLSQDALREEVLTLAEAASFLRVPEQAVLELVADQTFPAQKIGGEWRFLKKALEDWLRYGPRYFRDLRMFQQSSLLEIPLANNVILLLERRGLDKLEGTSFPHGKRGSKQAVLKHFGVFRDDADLEQRLADAKAQRGTAGGA